MAISLNSSEGTDNPESENRTLLVIGALVVTLLITLRFGWIGDDAAITFRVIDNFIHGHGLRWNIAERVQPYTHPLWMLTLVPLHWTFGEAFVSTIVFSAILSTVALALMLTRLCTSTGQIIVCAGLWILSGAIVDYSTSGLENPLAYLLIVLLVHEYWHTRPGGSVLRLSLFVSLLMLTRLDLALMVLPAWLSRMTPRAEVVRQAAVGFLPLILWELFSLFYYGFPFPNTAYAKLGGGISSAEMWLQGAIYIIHHTWADVITLAVIVVTALAIVCRRLSSCYPLLFGLLCYLIYIVSIGGDFMQGRMLSVPCVFALAIWAIAGVRSSPLTSVLVLGAALFVVGRSGGDEGILRKGGRPAWLPPSGIIDERKFYFAGTGLANANHNDPFPMHAWRDAGLGLRSSQQKVQVHGTVGMQGYFAGPELFIIDYFALTDPLLARLPAYRDRYWRVGHLHREVPAGYVESVSTNSNRLNDPELKTLYDSIRTVTRGDLFSAERLLEILRINLGWYRHLIDHERYLFPDLKSVKLNQLSRPVPDGSLWNGPSAILITNRTRVLIDLEAAREIEFVSVGVDHNDAYTFQFYRGKDLIHTEQVGPLLRPGGGINNVTIDVHLTGANGGITQVQVTGDSQNDDASLASFNIG